MIELFQLIAVSCSLMRKIFPEENFCKLLSKNFNRMSLKVLFIRVSSIAPEMSILFQSQNASNQLKARS